ncbi:hypothetical protein BDV41DRAFT_579904 [Aspergillus transmontanensis]|uniref:Uncharacterized protein n=1 Tax=Aspergillus transmontanensis TaxID=1034304 RepID=A0A5N6VPJ3_9EURO|nr:hypothetical protein BDV41DRAFT_579904 [Aspergillus transmontanensis]
MALTSEVTTTCQYLIRMEPPRRSSTSGGAPERPLVGDTTPDDGFVEEYLRAGGPNLCEISEYAYPFPKTTARDGSTFTCEGYCFDDVRAIAKKWNIGIINISFIGRKAYPNKFVVPIPTLSIGARWEVSSKGRWLEAAREIYQSLQGNGVDSISVEIVDRRLEMGPSFSPCKPTDAIYPLWGAVAEKILTSVDTSGFRSLGCHRIGYEISAEDCSPTIFLTLYRVCSREWQEVKQGIRNVLDEFKLFTVNVMIRKDNPIRYTDSTERYDQCWDEEDNINHRKHISIDNCSRPITLGDSVSVHNSTEHGTFGGWLELKNPTSGIWEPVGITCAHCIFPPEHQSKFPMFAGWEHNNGLPEIDSPSLLDVQAGIGEVEEAISCHKKLHLFQYVEQAKADGDTIRPADEDKWRKVQSHVDDLEAQKEILQFYRDSQAYSFGRVFAADFRELHARTTKDITEIDWALVRPSGDRAIGSNKLSELSDNALFAEAGIPESKLHLICGDRLYKIGRKTGLTYGVYNGLKTAVFDDKENNSETWVHTITGLRDTVASFGDSGALFFTRTGDVAGMCTGGSVRGGLVYFTHIHDLVDDIKQVTGVKDIRLKQD